MNRHPDDWPRTGAIDLDIQDLSHGSAATEWWYVHCHLRTDDGGELSLFAAFFRMVHGIDKDTGEKVHAHSVTWALSDPANKRYYQRSLVDRRSPEIVLERIRRGEGPRDPRLGRAMVEALERNHVPTPDRAFDKEIIFDESRLSLDFDGNMLDKLDDGSYRLTLLNPQDKIGCELVFKPERGAVRQGDDGVVGGMRGEDMFYYFIPRCKVSGSITQKEAKAAVISGYGWYEHEFGGYHPGAGPDAGTQAGGKEGHQSAWNWSGIQLDDGSEISAYSIAKSGTDGAVDKWLYHVHPDGRVTHWDDMVLEPVEWWRSMRTFTDYPVQWRLTSRAAGLDLSLQADFDDQEFITIISSPAFWEGRCKAEGALDGRRVSGLAFVERSGFGPLKDLDDFFSAVGETVRDSLKDIISLDPTHEQVRDLIASKDREHYMEGVDIDQIVRALFKPLREIIDRGGKSWRSYAALLCSDVVGGDSRKFVKWLSMPELIHVGSLIVDDVEDHSTVRRGGPACHLIYGEAKAINAGNAAYFLGQRLLHSDEISDANKLRIYDLYFEALRAGHAGQAIDLDGIDEMMERAVQSGDSTHLERSVLARQRLKTAVPASSLARMGAIAGGGSEEQIDGLGRFFEALGMSFQIIDDVLNLRGFEGDLKVRGEDITAGKVTLPIAKGMSRLPLEDRLWMWSAIKSRSDDPGTVSRVIGRLEDCGAMDACVGQAEELVEAAWNDMEPLLEDSFPKIMLRAFSWYLLERHY
jgi:geranylgeranyl pyrophosphate synthase/predicted secreted hydrolase